MPNPAEPRFPTHVAIIVDGNRRWAKQRLLPVSMGHKAGFDRLREITRYAVGDRGVFVLSLYVDVYKRQAQTPARQTCWRWRSCTG